MAFMDFTRTALKNLFSKPATRQYPQVPREYPARSRGHVEIDMETCILCGLCSRKCPSGAITVDRAAGIWSIDRMGCVQCADCTTGCPKHCLQMQPGYTPPGPKKLVDVYQKPQPEQKEEAAPQAARSSTIWKSAFSAACVPASAPKAPSPWTARRATPGSLTAAPACSAAHVWMRVSSFTPCPLPRTTALPARKPIPNPYDHERIYL